MKRAVFLDRDGVINKAIVSNGMPLPPKSLSELEILPKLNESLTILRDLKFEIIVVTNQPDVSRGTLSIETVGSIHQSLEADLGLKYFYVCFHDDSDKCECRKPKPGLLLKAATELNIDLKKSFMVGDRWRDIEAGQAAGCNCFFIDYGFVEKTPEMPYQIVSSLFDAVQIISEEFYGHKA